MITCFQVSAFFAYRKINLSSKVGVFDAESFLNHVDQFGNAEIQISIVPYYWVYLVCCTMDLVATGVSIRQKEVY